MITVKPAIHRNTLELKQTASASTHTTGDFYMHNEHAASHGLYQSCTIVHTDLNGVQSNYEGHVRVTIDGVRRIDGSSIHLGTARFKIDSSNVGITTTNLLESDSEWNSWVNATSGADGLQDYLQADLHSLYFINFFKGDFTNNEVDASNNGVAFKNSYALDYTIKIEFLHRRPAILNQTSIIHCVPNLDRQNNNINLNVRPEVNTEQGTSDINAAFYLGLGCNKPGGIFIQNDNDFDYLFYGVFSNETESAGSSRVLPYSATLSDRSPYNRHNFMNDWIRNIRSLTFTGTLQTGMPMGNCHVDLSDPLNGGNPVMYHQTAFRTGTTPIIRQVGYTALSDAPSEESYFTGLSASDGSRTRAKYPIIEDQGNCAVSVAGFTATTTSYIIVNVLSQARANGRPVIYTRSNAIGLLVNSGTYESPAYTKMLAFNTNTGLSNTGSVRYSHNSPSVPSFAKGITLVNLIDGEDGWYYASVVRSSGSTRGTIRMRYTGADSLSDVWDFFNWEFEEVLSYTPSSTNTFISATTSITETMTNVGFASALMGNVPYGTLNGYPIFWGFIDNKFCKFYHNGGTSGTLSDNWSVQIVAGSNSTTSTFPTAGVGMNADFTNNIVNSWYYRKQVVDGWLYFQDNTTSYLGRICIDDTNPDYLKFEPLNVSSTTAANTTSNHF